MADEHVPGPPSKASTQFTTPPVVPPPSENGVASDKDAAPGGRAPHSVMPRPDLLGRWLLGCGLVLACGHGLLGLVWYLLIRSHVEHQAIFLVPLAALDLALFFWLERSFWLSRYMSLRVEPGTHAWHSAVMLWLLGVPGLLFRSTNFHPEAEARARPQPTPRNDGFREVVETVVFVVVLVLLLKSFAAEAFVIPTGSMAQTLLGYQKEVTCPDCGIKFPINCSQEVDPNEGSPSPVFACVCPNCRQQIHFPSAGEDYVRTHPDSVLIDDPGWGSGDRVLVAKFVYDLLGKLPDRLDVVVFKYPGSDRFPQDGPHKHHVPMNYIKRLIGLPGETIAIRGGKLYHLPRGKGPSYGDYERARHDPELMATLWQKDPYMHVDDGPARDLFEKGQFQIVRKSPENILSMMRLVYDNDHPSRRHPLPRWQAPNGWSDAPPHGFRHDPVDSGQTDWLTYHHLLRDNGGQPALITDVMGYNTYQTAGHLPLLGNNWVGDLVLECEVTVDNPQGELTLELSRGVDRFRARWDLASGGCDLLRVNDNGEQKLESRTTALRKKGTYRLRFANVDQRLVVWVNGDLPFDNEVTYPPPPRDRVGPTRENDLMQPAGIGVRGGGVTVRKLRLFRDTYYSVGGAQRGIPSDPDVPNFDPTQPSTWDGWNDPPLVTLYVQPDHFLCLGDNSPESSDGRSWGVVPRRLLLGRALLVYYPFGRAGRIR